MPTTATTAPPVRLPGYDYNGSLFFEVERRRATVAQKLSALCTAEMGAEIEERLFAQIFNMWASRDDPPQTTQRWKVFTIVMQLQCKANWRLYFARARHLAFNLRHHGDFLVKMGAEWVVSARPWDFCPERWLPSAEAAIYDWTKVDEEEAQKEEDTSFTCYKCRSHRVTYTQLQTRSADEGLTNYFYCLNCKNRWKN